MIDKTVAIAGVVGADLVIVTSIAVFLRNGAKAGGEPTLAIAESLPAAEMRLKFLLRAPMLPG